jgi:cell division protein FtsN
MSMVLTFRAGKLAALAAAVAILAACSREQQDWRSAEASDSVEAYGEFLKDHPDSDLARQARARFTQLSEDRAWQQAGSADTVAAYKQFLAQYPNGKWSQEAHIRVENFELGMAPTGAGATDAASSAASVSAIAAGPSTAASNMPPSSGNAAGAPLSEGAPAQAPASPASAVPPSPAIASAWRSADTTAFGVQLGAFASENAATSQWQQLVSRFNEQLRGLAPHVVSAETATGRLFRLQALVADEATARALCDMLRKESQACVPVLPH